MPRFFVTKNHTLLQKYKIRCIRVFFCYSEISCACISESKRYFYHTFIPMRIIMTKKGMLIVIDGTDGSGKKTQVQMLADCLQQDGYAVEKIDFPQYGKKSAGPTEEYLNGVYGTAGEVTPYQASLLYAVDRFAASKQMKERLNAGKIVLSDRYVSANMGHQAGKIENLAERDQFLDWIQEIEYGIFNIPKPDLQIFLYLDPEISRKRALQVEKLNMDKSKDIHENDAMHMQKASEAFLYVAQKYGWNQIDCKAGEEIKSREALNNELYALVLNTLQKRT